MDDPAAVMYFLEGTVAARLFGADSTCLDVKERMDRLGITCTTPIKPNAPIELPKLEDPDLTLAWHCCETCAQDAAAAAPGPPRDGEMPSTEVVLAVCSCFAAASGWWPLAELCATFPTLCFGTLSLATKPPSVATNPRPWQRIPVFGKKRFRSSQLKVCPSRALTLFPHHLFSFCGVSYELSIVFALFDY
jgi:hypothetical protein